MRPRLCSLMCPVQIIGCGCGGPTLGQRQAKKQLWYEKVKKEKKKRKKKQIFSSAGFVCIHATEVPPSSLLPAGGGMGGGLGGDVGQLAERRAGTPLTQVRFLGAARDFSVRVDFQCRLS